MNELIKLSAKEVIALLKKREVAPVELVDVVAERVAEVENKVNAIPTLCLERARDHARYLTDHPVKDPPGWHLYGLPIVIKDLTDVKGVKTTYGSTVFADNIPDESDLFVEILEKNGAVVIGKSNTPEFGAGGNTFNEVFGWTANPWNTGLTCGGSSGGSAVAVATGEVWLAAGSDLAGSLRTPASFCSVVGLRPSPGRIPCRPNSLLYETMGVQGPMARNVIDTALMLDAQIGCHPGDPMSLPRPSVSYLEAVLAPIRPKRIGYSPDLGITPVDPEVAEICGRAVKTWEGLGTTIEEASPDFTRSEEIFQNLRAQIFLRFKPLLEQYRHHLKPEVVWNIEQGLKLTAFDICKAEQMRVELYRSTLEFFNKYDLLICPATVAPPFDINIRYLEVINGHKFATYISWLAPTFAVTLTTCPSISVPCGFTKAGLPVGLQIVGPPRAEDRLLAAAHLFEMEHGIARATPIDPIEGEGSGA